MAQTSSSFDSLSPLGHETLHTYWQGAFQALQSLQTSMGIMASGEDGIFHAIFGRDSLWCILIALEAGHLLRQAEQSQAVNGPVSLARSADYDAWLHELAVTALRGLTRVQGHVVNDFNEEQPGRIVHEYWHPVPPRMLENRWPLVDGRYYGSFDATFLYVITIARINDYFHDTGLLEELWPGVELALNWMLAWSDLDQDGLVEYQRRNPERYGLINQVWKDSSESIQPHKREEIHYPLAWIELQGYAWAAYTSYLDLVASRPDLDAHLQREIEQRIGRLQQGLDRFWLADEHIFAIALDGQKQPVRAVSSNPGHLLWSGILRREQAAEVGQRLLKPDMLTPWGLRTLSEGAYYYNPFRYQCGAVWPFDTTVTAIGLNRYGFATEARGLARSILAAIETIGSPVELYMVLSSASIRSPKLDNQWMLVDYYEACNVQAWTAASMLYLTALLRFWG